MDAILIMSAKLATLGFHEIKAVGSESYDFIISASSITDKTLSRDSNCIADVVM